MAKLKVEVRSRRDESLAKGEKRAKVNVGCFNKSRTHYDCVPIDQVLHKSLFPLFHRLVLETRVLYLNTWTGGNRADTNSHGQWR